MTTASAPEPELPADPTLEVAERQLAMLRRLAQIAMDVSEAFASSSIASAKAAEGMLVDKYFIPEVGRANACGAKDAAASFQKVSRALRLTLMLEKTTAEWVRDLRLGLSVKDAGGAPAVQGAPDSRDRRRLAGSCSNEQARDRDRRDSETERFIDIERPDVLPPTAFRETVDRICADLGAAVDWTQGKIASPELEGRAECRRRATVPRTAPAEPNNREAALSP